MLILFIFRISILSEGFETSAQQFGSGKLSRWLNFCQSIFTFLPINFIFLPIHFLFLSTHSYVSVNPFLHFCRSILYFCQSILIFLLIHSYISDDPFYIFQSIFYYLLTGYISVNQFYNHFHNGFCAPYISNPNYMLIIDFR
jgi:hypothetical protein